MDRENEHPITAKDNFMNENTNQDRSPALLSYNGFEMAQRMATALSKSSLIPEVYRDNLPNCLIALEMAQRMSASPMMVMQNLYIVHGKPAWSSQFVIAAINATKRFSPLRFEMTGTDQSRQCVAWATELATKERLEGPPVSMAMAKAEGWLGKNGSKWQTMPELMLRYRSATFFGRLYAPEVLMGMKEESEVIDIDSTVTRTEMIERPRITVPATVVSTSTNGETVPQPEEPPKKRGRGKAKPPEPESEKPASTAAHADASEMGDVIAKISAKLKESSYTEHELLLTAIANNWIDRADVGDVPSLEVIGLERLKVFLANWDNLVSELEFSRKAVVKNAGDDLFK